MDLPLGALCDACRKEIHRRASRWARWVSLGTTAAFGFYAMSALPTDQGARMVGAAGTLVWYLVVRRVVYRVAATWFETKGDGMNRTPG